MNPDHIALVSCIMPTSNRRRFVGQAIQYFCRQDYPQKELIIIDDGEDAVADLIPQDDRIHYIRLNHRVTLGAKYNLACKQAQGTLVAHWDDDDWMSPKRLSLQVEALQATKAQLCGARELLHYHLEAGQAWLLRSLSGERTRLAGGTLLYSHQVWERHPFREADDPDLPRFIASLDPGRIHITDNPSFYVAVIHTENTHSCNLNDPQWRRHPIEGITARLGADRAFYVTLRNGKQNRQGVDIRNRYSVSCIMPTYNRRDFVSQSIRYFQKQDYPLRELIIVDDGTQPVADLVPKEQRIRYIRLPARVSIGEKRNVACEAAKGDLIILWDDDDWYGPQRISRQVTPLLEGRFDLTALGTSPFFNLTTGEFWMCEDRLLERIFPKGVISATLAFWKVLWGTHARFPHTSLGEDADFLKILLGRGARLGKIQNEDLFVYVRHQSNTWQMGPGSFVDGNAWRKTKVPSGLSQDDLKFYSLRKNIFPRKDAPKSKTEIKQTVVQIPKEKQASISGHPMVSACLLSYKRPHHMQRIVNSLQSYEFIDEILVWNNNPDINLSLQGDKVKVIHASENTLCLGRFLCAKQARNEVIYVQDDDVIVKNVSELYQCFLKDPTRITHNLSNLHYERQNRAVYSEGHYALLGWGSFFLKEWMDVLDGCQKISDDFIFRRAADKFFTILQGKRHTTLLGDLSIFPDSHARGLALYLEPNSRFWEAQATRRALAMAREKKKVRFPVTWNVVIVCHNYGRYLREAVHSVLLNDADYVMTIVDDNSTDETSQVCAALSSEFPWISTIRHDQNVQVSRAANSGIAHTDSLFVVLLDADDKIGPNYLFEAEKLLRSGCDVVNPDAILFGDKNDRWVVPNLVTLPMLLQKNDVHCCSAFRRSYWAQVGGIDENIHNWQDYDFWIRLAAAGARIRRLPGDHFYYRKHGPSKAIQSEAIREQLIGYFRKKHKNFVTPELFA
jgi:glycosyltransferase involved in cell wall biosynthesis